MLGGGYIKDIPLPHKRRYPSDCGERRRVRINISRYDMAGGIHWYASIHEANNPIWDPRTHAEADPQWEEVQGTEYGNRVIGWHQAWDDDEGRGREFSKRCQTRQEAIDFVEGIIAEHFSGDGYEIESTFGQPYEKYLYRHEGD
jgi:hypothetical protein